MEIGSDKNILRFHELLFTFVKLLPSLTHRQKIPLALKNMLLEIKLRIRDDAILGTGTQFHFPENRVDFVAARTFFCCSDTSNHLLQFLISAFVSCHF